MLVDIDLQGIWKRMYESRDNKFGKSTNFITINYNNNVVKKKFKDGVVIWYKNNETHRDGDLPAFIYPEGTKLWYKNGKIHRKGGPAIIYSDGTKQWYKDGKLHRDDGPAVIWPGEDYDSEWYIDGKRVFNDG